MVKSQHVALNKAMKRERVAMLKTQSEIKGQMNLINTAFNNSQKKLQNEFQSQKDSAEECMTKVFNESDEHVKQLTENYEHAQGKFEDFFANKTETLDSKFNTQTEIVDHLIKTVLNESKQLQQMVDVYIEESKNIAQGLEDGLKEALEQMRNKLLEHLNDETSALKSRITSQENSHLSLNSRLTSELNGLQNNLRSYKSDADSVRGRVTSIEGRMTSHHVGFSAELKNKLPSISKGTRLIFDHEHYDGWYDYDSSTGIFTAPISGMYMFLFTVQCYPTKLAHVCLYVSGFCTADARAGGEGGGITSSNFLVTYLSAGTKVWVQTAVTFESSSYDIWPYRTTFSGVLIHI